MRRLHQGGHTVVEVLIAVAVAAVGFAAVFSLQMGSMLANISARDMSAAMTLGERYVEVLRRDSFAWVGDQRPGPYMNREAGRWHSFSVIFDNYCRGGNKLNYPFRGSK